MDLVPLSWTDCRITSADVGAQTVRELTEVLALIKIMLLSSQMSFEEFRADSLSLPWVCPGHVNNLIKKQVFPPALGGNTNNTL